MLSISLSNSMQKAVNSYLDKGSSALFDIELVLKSEINKDFKFTPLYINAIDILQDYKFQYSDEFVVDFDVSTPEYIHIVENYQSLICHIKFVEVFKDYRTKGQVFYSNSFKAILKDKKDLTKEFNIKDLKPSADVARTEAFDSNRVKVELELIEKELYNIRRVRQHFTLRNVTMDEILLVICEQLNIPTVHIVPSDNKRVYKCFIYPVFYTLNEVLDYLQNETDFGIYDYGLGFYYTTDILYIYPKYRLKVDNDELKFHIYDVGQGFMGAESYYTIDDKDPRKYHVISNNGSDHIEVVSEIIENEANSVISHSAIDMLEGSRRMIEGDYVRNENNTYLRLDDSFGFVKDVENTVFMEENANPHVVSTFLNKKIRDFVQLSWDNCIPFLINPVTQIKYHYDDKDRAFRYKHSLCEEIQYKIRPVENFGSYVYTATSLMRLAVTPDSLEE